jgi:large subunit ribosomal protein L18
MAYTQTKIKAARRERRKHHIRKKVFGTAERPRLTIFRSLNHIYAQVIDDVSGRTLASASTTEADLEGKASGNRAAAETMGTLVAERAKKAGIARVIFDRNGFIYHGRVKALADAARKAGLEF